MDNQIYADRDCVETGSGCSLKGKVVVPKESALEAGFGQQFYYCMGGSRTNGNALGKSVFSVNLKNGEFERCTRGHMLEVSKSELLSDEEKLQLSRIHPPGVLPLENHESQCSEYSFLEDGRYVTGVQLCDEKKIMEHVKMQKPYQHRITFCDRNGFCVWEVWCGMQIYPPQERLGEMREGLMENLGPIQLQGDICIGGWETGLSSCCVCCMLCPDVYWFL